MALAEQESKKSENLMIWLQSVSSSTAIAYSMVNSLCKYRILIQRTKISKTIVLSLQILIARNISP